MRAMLSRQIPRENQLVYTRVQPQNSGDLQQRQSPDRRPSSQIGDVDLALDIASPRGWL